jgi:NitT/TauT family transport system ATP-binding protein
MSSAFLVATAAERTAALRPALHETPDVSPEIASLSLSRPVPPASIMVGGISKRFVSKRQEVQALDDVSLEIAQGEFVCLIGPSGCGKSTLLDIMAGLTRPDAGSVWSEGARVTGPARDRMVMFQDPALFPWLDAFGNVMFGLKLKPGLTKAQRRQAAEQHLDMVGLSAFAHTYVHELSGGMKQRVALARALAPDPKILLMDEPFAALDAITREQLYVDLERIWMRTRKTIVFVTHNVREAACLGDRVILMSPRPGRIAHELTISLPRPRDINSPELAKYAGEMARSLKHITDSAQP